MVSSAYLKLIFLPANLIPACASSSPAFHMMYSTYKLIKQGDNICSLDVFLSQLILCITSDILAVHHSWKVLVAQSCLPFCDPLDYSPPGSSVHSILQARILKWVPFPSPGDLPDPGIEPGSPALQADSLFNLLAQEFSHHCLHSPCITFCLLSSP